MKKALAIVVFLSLFAQCIAQLGVMGYYELNKEYIAKNLCENKDNPELNCCGKCYLRKQLKKTEGSNSSKNLPSKTGKNEVVTYILPSASGATMVYRYQAELAIQNPVSQHLFGFNFLPFVFHPPSVFC